MNYLSKRELERIDIYEILIRGEMSSARRRRYLGQLLSWHKKFLTEKEKRRVKKLERSKE